MEVALSVLQESNKRIVSSERSSESMLIVYDSLTGNVERFVDKLGTDSVKITKDLSLDDPFVLITYTIKFGQVPKSTDDFLKNNHRLLMGVASSGNRNWGDELFAKAATTIAMQYEVPIIAQFELAGTERDVKQFKERLRKIERH